MRRLLLSLRSFLPVLFWEFLRQAPGNQGGVAAGPFIDGEVHLADPPGVSARGGSHVNLWIQPPKLDFAKIASCRLGLFPSHEYPPS